MRVKEQDLEGKLVKFQVFLLSKISDNQALDVIDHVRKEYDLIPNDNPIASEKDKAAFLVDRLTLEQQRKVMEYFNGKYPREFDNYLNSPRSLPEGRHIDPSDPDYRRFD